MITNFLNSCRRRERYLDLNEESTRAARWFLLTSTVILMLYWILEAREFTRIECESLQPIYFKDLSSEDVWLGYAIAFFTTPFMKRYGFLVIPSSFTLFSSFSVLLLKLRRRLGYRSIPLSMVWRDPKVRRNTKLSVLVLGSLVFLHDGFLIINTTTGIALLLFGLLGGFFISDEVLGTTNSISLARYSITIFMVLVTRAHFSSSPPLWILLSLIGISSEQFFNPLFLHGQFIIYFIDNMSIVFSTFLVLNGGCRGVFHEEPSRTLYFLSHCLVFIFPRHANILLQNSLVFVLEKIALPSFLYLVSTLGDLWRAISRYLYAIKKHFLAFQRMAKVYLKKLERVLLRIVERISTFVVPLVLYGESLIYETFFGYVANSLTWVVEMFLFSCERLKDNHLTPWYNNTCGLLKHVCTRLMTWWRDIVQTKLVAIGQALKVWALANRIGFVGLILIFTSVLMAFSAWMSIHSDTKVAFMIPSVFSAAYGWNLIGLQWNIQLALLPWRWSTVSNTLFYGGYKTVSAFRWSYLFILSGVSRRSVTSLWFFAAGFVCFSTSILFLGSWLKLTRLQQHSVRLLNGYAAFVKGLALFSLDVLKVFTSALYWLKLLWYPMRSLFQSIWNKPSVWLVASLTLIGIVTHLFITGKDEELILALSSIHSNLYTSRNTSWTAWAYGWGASFYELFWSSLHEGIEHSSVFLAIIVSVLGERLVSLRYHVDTPGPGARNLIFFLVLNTGIASLIPRLAIYYGIAGCVWFLVAYLVVKHESERVDEKRRGIWARIEDVRTKTPSKEEFERQLAKIITAELPIAHPGTKTFGGTDCGICRVEYDDPKTTHLLVCGHRFHTDCIVTWLIRSFPSHSQLCPICMKSVWRTQGFVSDFFGSSEL